MIDINLICIIWPLLHLWIFFPVEVTGFDFFFFQDPELWPRCYTKILKTVTYPLWVVKIHKWKCELNDSTWNTFITVFPCHLELWQILSSRIVLMKKIIYWIKGMVDSAIEKVLSLLYEILCLSWVLSSHLVYCSGIIVATKPQLSKHAGFLWAPRVIFCWL